MCGACRWQGFRHAVDGIQIVRAYGVGIRRLNRVQFVRCGPVQEPIPDGASSALGGLCVLPAGLNPDMLSSLFADDANRSVMLRSAD